MYFTEHFDLSHLFLIGINYKKADAVIRGQFAIDNEQYENILNVAPEYGIDSLFVLSTCNRTELFGFVQNPNDMISLLCTQTKGNEKSFKKLAYIKSGQDAIQHFFNVGAGLDSQILGDYEITGQLKQALNFARERGRINCFIDRLFSYVLQASKTIRNETILSSGSVSVSFAAIQYIKENITESYNKNILVVGIGKIGRNTCKNLVDYLGNTNITLINRSEEKAINLASELNLQQAPIEKLSGCCAKADIIFLATNACDPIILNSYLQHKGDKLIIDLSVPNNVEDNVSELPNIKMIGIDELSKLKDHTLHIREGEVPRAEKIIADYITQFMEWYAKRKNAHTLNAVKLKLNEILLLQKVVYTDQKPSDDLFAENKIKKIVNGLAGKMRYSNQYGCHYIEAINEFI